MKFTFLLISGLLLLVSPIFAQKLILLEKAGKIKPKKYGIGTQFTYKLKGEESWRTESVIGLDIDNDLIIFEGIAVKVSQIEALQTKRGLTKTLKASLVTFGASVVFYSLYATIFGQGKYVNWKQTAVVAPSSLIIGWGVDKIFHKKKIKLGKKRRIRLTEIPVMM